MTHATRKGELLTQITRERALWDQLVAAIGDAQMTQPGATGDWTFRDVVAHLNAWRNKTLAQLDAAQRNSLPSSPPWPAHLNEDDDVEQINDWIYRANRDRPLQEVLDEYQHSFQRIHDAVTALSEDDLTATNRYPWTEGRSLVTVIEDSFGHFHDEHELALRAWLAQIQAAPRRT